MTIVFLLVDSKNNWKFYTKSNEYLYEVNRKGKKFKRRFLAGITPFYSCVFFIVILLKVNYILDHTFVPVICIASRM